MQSLNYIELLLIFVSTVARCISMSAFSYLVGIPIEIMSSIIGLKICVITSRIKKYKSIIKKKKKKHGKIVLLAKSKFNSIEARISKALIGSNIEWMILFNKCCTERFLWYEGRN